MRRFVAIAVVAASAILIASAADAAPRKKARTPTYADPPGTVFTSRDETGRTRTRIIVQKRSYLDGGTEVMPGDMRSSNYLATPTYRPSGALGRNDTTNPVGPILDPWWIPGKNNPWPWFAF